MLSINNIGKNLGTTGVVLGWSMFAGTHLFLSHQPIRNRLREKLGAGPFAGIYSVVALATFIPTTYFYFKHGKGLGKRVLPANRLTQFAGNALKYSAVIFFGAVLASPPPPIKPDAPSDPAKEGEVLEPQGIQRVTRHSLFFSLALLGMGNILTRGFYGDVLYWSGFPIFWLIGSWHQDQRYRKTLPKSYFEQTSLFPFVSILLGRTSGKKAVEELNKPTMVASAVVPFFLF